jgi:dihydroxy-acid dehydratase
VAVEGAQLDGMVCLTSCDKTVPGQLMAAARLNVPTLLVPCGYQASGEYKGQHVDIEEVFIHSMHAQIGGGTATEDVVGMSRCAIRSPGVCSGLGTANTMHIVCEALGMALPGSAPVAALSRQDVHDVRAAGTRIVQMVWDDLKPRDILSPGAFANAVKRGAFHRRLAQHGQAPAGGGDRGRNGVDVYGLFETLGPTTPVLAGVRPIGEHLIEEFEAAGGCRALMKQLLPCWTRARSRHRWHGRRQPRRRAEVGNAEVIRPIDRPVAPLPAIILLRGNLAPEGGLIKTGIAERKVRRFTGPAVCFETSDAAVAALKPRPSRRLGDRDARRRRLRRPGHGRRRFARGVRGRRRRPGRPGRHAHRRPSLRPGLQGLVVAEVAPEAALGGPLALVRDGDT